MPRKAPSSIERNIALCYIRKSVSIASDESDKASPERQRANILKVCAQYNWIPEWYEDIEGHKSGRYEDNRPGWLALKQRFADPRVAALVANDQARLSRKVWHVGRLVEEVDARGIRIVLAAPGREIDTSTPQGRMWLTFVAMQDQAFAEDISQRQKDSIAYRKSLGKSIGMPPFGTQRNDAGFLAPTDQGAWLLTSGIYVAGTQDAPPEPDAHWFGYFDCLKRIYALYAENRNGLNRLAYHMTAEGWRFRDRKGQPRPLTTSDIRRVVGGWREYAGMPTEGRGRDKNASRLTAPSQELVDTGRAVLPLALLRAVATVQEARSITTRDTGVKPNNRTYALTGLVYCAHCEAEAASQGNAGLRSKLGGVTQRGRQWYRHVEGRQCSAQKRSIPLDELEADIGRLLSLLTLSGESLELLAELARKEAGNVTQAEEEAFERERANSLAQLKRRTDANLHLYQEGTIGRSEFERKRSEINRETAHWQNRTTDSRRIELDLRQCVTALTAVATEFAAGTPEKRQALVRSLFDYLVYDMDERRIKDFRLQSWADRYIVVRASILETEYQGNLRGMLHTGFEPVFWP